MDTIAEMGCFSDLVRDTVNANFAELALVVSGLVFNVLTYGAFANGVADDSAAFNAACTAAALHGGNVFVPPGTYRIAATIVVPTNVTLYGTGRASKLVASGLTAELVRLNGNYSAVQGLWLNGPGQVANTADGRRGIWIGSSSNHAVTAYTDYARVEGCYIDQFTGNGISGDYRYARILNNTIQNTTDACLFLQPSCVFNLVSGNTLTGCRYSGIDCNGSDNRIVNNYCASNGGGTLDQGSWNGILVCYIPGAAVDPNANRNIIEGNRCVGNQGSGILVLGTSASGTTPIAPYGNIVRGNICTGHVNFVGRTDWGAGICVLGASDTIVTGNVCDGNTFNYVVCGSSVGPLTGVQVTHNQSINALTNATLTGLGQPSGCGYFFPGSGRIDGVGGNTVQHLVLSGNWDRYAASDAYRVDLALASAVNWTGWTITDNHFDTPTGYGFNIVSPASFLNFNFGPSNYGTGAGSGSFRNINALGLTANSATPSVANGRIFFTQNSAPTAYTNFASAAPGQQIAVLVKDANTTFDFSGTNLKGNIGVDFAAANGDSILATFDGTNWFCVVERSS